MAKEEKQEQQEFVQWIHAQVKDQVLWERFVKMADAHQGGRSAFVRWLIDREWARRGTGPLSTEVLPDAEQRLQNGNAHWVGSDEVSQLEEQDAKKMIKKLKGDKE